MRTVTRAADGRRKVGRGYGTWTPHLLPIARDQGTADFAALPYTRSTFIRTTMPVVATAAVTNRPRTALHRDPLVTPRWDYDCGPPWQLVKETASVWPPPISLGLLQQSFWLRSCRQLARPLVACVASPSRFCVRSPRTRYASPVATTY